MAIRLSKKAARLPQQTEDAFMTQTLTIPDYLPPTLNMLMSGKLSRRIGRKRECYSLVAGHAMEQQLVKANWKRRVTVKLTLAPSNKIRDGDSSFKVLVDGLVKAGLLLDDSPAWCEVSPLVQERGAGKRCPNDNRLKTGHMMSDDGKRCLACGQRLGPLTEVVLEDIA